MWCFSLEACRALQMSWKDADEHGVPAGAVETITCVAK